jgi:hypothetical protein
MLRPEPETAGRISTPHSKQNAHMKTNLHILIGSLLLLAAGCTPLKYNRTVALPGLPPVSDANQVRVVENLSEVTQPYQIVGKVTVYREGTRIMKNKSIERMSTQAAAMGADGIIGVHQNAGGGMYSCLAVKWLAPGETPKPATVPFIVAVLPIVPDPTAKGDQDKVIAVMEQVLHYPLESKGYYLLPGKTAGCDGGIEGAKHLNDASLQALGGPNAHVLLDLAFAGRSDVNILIASGSTISIRATLMEKSTRKVLYENVGTGRVSAGFLINAMAPNAKRMDAAMIGTMAALRDLKPIHQ